MGTRSLTHIKTAGKTSKTLCTIYRQYDGYPEGMGADLAAIIAPRKLVYAFQHRKAQANGMGCLATLIIAALKGDDCENVYVYPVNAKDQGEDYTYVVYAQGDEVRISCVEDAIDLSAAEFLAAFGKNSAAK